METFEFYLDQKVTTWMRTPFEIEAKSLEEAKQKAIEFHKSGKTGGIGWEEVEGVQEPMTIGENNNEPTEELYCDEDNNKVWDNGVLHTL